jgi:hypothetical protein
MIDDIIRDIAVRMIPFKPILHVTHDSSNIRTTMEKTTVSLDNANLSFLEKKVICNYNWSVIDPHMGNWLESNPSYMTVSVSKLPAPNSDKKLVMYVHAGAIKTEIVSEFLSLVQNIFPLNTTKYAPIREAYKHMDVESRECKEIHELMLRVIDYAVSEITDPKISDNIRGVMTLILTKYNIPSYAIPSNRGRHSRRRKRKSNW